MTEVVSVEVAPVESVTVNVKLYVPGPPWKITVGCAVAAPRIKVAGSLELAVH